MLWWTSITILVAIALTSAQTAPPNDECSGAKVFTLGDTIYCDLNYAKPDGASTPSGCGGWDTTGKPVTAYINAGVWYSFTGTGRRAFIFPGTKTFRPVEVSVYIGDDCGVESLQCLTGLYLWDDHPPYRSFAFATTLGVTYRMLVRRAGNPSRDILVDSNFALQTSDLPVLNDNDSCSAATSFFVGQQADGDGTFSTSDELEVSDDCLGGKVTYSRPGVWYKFQGTGDKLAVTAPEASVVTIYTGACGEALTCVAGMNFDSYEVLLNSNIETTYYALLRSREVGSLGTHYIKVSPIDPALDWYKNYGCSTAHPILIGALFQAGFKYAPFQTGYVVPSSISGQYFGDRFHRGLWYSFVGTGGRVTVVGTCINPRDQFATLVDVFTGACGVSTLRRVASVYVSDCQEAPSTFNTESGTTYYLLVKGRKFFTNFQAKLVAAPLLLNDNDVCAKSTPIAVGSSILGNNITLATSDENEVYDDCSCKTVTLWSSRGLWYSFYGTGGTVWIDVCGDIRVAERMTLDVSVYKGSCGPTSLQCVAGTELATACSERFKFQTEAGTEYKVLVQNKEEYGSTATSLFDIKISSVTTLPSNDVCSGAQPVTIGDKIAGDVAFATIDDFEVGTLCDGEYRGIYSYPGLWYTFQGTGTNVRVTSICSARWSYSVIHIYKGSCGPSTLQCVTGYTIDCSAPSKNTFVFTTDASSAYYMLVSKLLDPRYTSSFEVKVESIPNAPFVQYPSVPVSVAGLCRLNDVPVIPTPASPVEAPIPAATAPTKSQTTSPTSSPTQAPDTELPTTPPTAAPTTSPTAAPTTSPTAAPTTSPTAAPTTSPTMAPQLPMLTGLDLYNANTNRKMTTLTDGQSIRIPPGMVQRGPALNVVATFNSDTNVQSVVFAFGDNPRFRTESKAPFALCSKRGNDIFSCGRTVLGCNGGSAHTVTATPYSSIDGLGTAGPSITVAFTIAGCSSTRGGGGGGRQ
jgi:hypothetical protein